MRVELLPKQFRFVESMSPMVFYSGAWAAGKTRALCWKSVMRARRPGAVEGLCRKHNVSLKRTTLRTLLQPEGNLPPVLPPGTYTHYKQDGIIKLNGGGEIMYFGLDDPQRVGSINLSGIGIDEAVELDEDEFGWAVGRPRIKIDGMPIQRYMVGNPGPPSHHLAKRFGIAGHEQQDGCEVIQTSAFENFFLAQETRDYYQTLTGLPFKRYVLGQWVGSEGLVYDRWDRDVHVQSRAGPWKRVWIGVDDGYTAPFACVRICEDGDGRLHVEREVYRSGMQRDEKIATVREMAAGGVEAVVVDSAAAELIDALKSVGLPARGANKSVSVKDGITLMLAPMLLDAGDGRVRLTVDPGCEALIREFESYEWKPGKDEPVKENDHALDALRYVRVHMDKAPAFVFRVIGGRS